MKKSHKIYAIVASFIVMFIMAVTESIRGVLIPTFMIDFNVDDKKIGMLLLISTFAYVVGTYIAGVLSRKMNQKQIAILGMIISGSGFLGTSFATTFPHLIVGYVILTIGIGFIVLGLNTIVPAIKVAYIGIIINLLHFFYGVGATLTQRVGGYLITAGVNWRHMFIAFACLYVVGIIIYTFVDQPKKEQHEKSSEKIHSYEVPIIVLFCIGLGFYVASEMQTLNWLLNYQVKLFGYTEDQASRYVALFFGMLATGRLIGGYIIEKIGYLKGITIATTLALFTYCIGLIDESTLVVLSISGIFFSIVYPTTILVIQKVFEHNAMRVVSIVTMAASLVNMISGYVIGYLNVQIGIRASYFSIPISLGVALVMFVMIRLEMKRLDKNREEYRKVTV